MTALLVRLLLTPDPGWRHPDTVRAVLALSAVILLAAIAAAFAADSAATAWAQSIDGPARAALRALTRFGKSDWILIPLGVSLLALHLLPRVVNVTPERDLGRLTRRLGFLFLAVAGSGILAVALKYGLGMPRPSAAATGALPIRFTLDPAFASFPSGHTTTAAALAMAVTLVAPWAGLVLWPFAVGVGVSRMVVGAHHLSDVVAGFGLGAFSVLALAVVLGRRGYGFGAGAGPIPAAEPYPARAVVSDLRAFTRFCLASARALTDTRGRRSLRRNTR